MNRISQLAAALALTAALAAPALAYIPPSHFVIQNMARKKSGVKSVRVRSIVTAYDGDKPGALKFKETTIFNAQTGVLRSWAYDETDKVIYVVERKEAMLPVVDELLLDSRAKEISIALREKGVPIKTEDELLQLPDEEARRGAEIAAISRWKGGVAWVIGPKGKPDPQLWVEKDTFLPVRLMWGQQGASESVDLQLENYRFFREFPYPRSIVYVKKGNVPVLKDDVVDVTLNKDTSEPKNPIVPGFTDAGNSASGTLRDLVKSYYEVIR